MGRSLSPRLRLVLAACGCMALIGCGGGASTPIASPAVPTDGGIVVTPMAELTAFVRAQVGDVIAAGPGFLVVGYTARPDNGVDGAVWTSADGLAWVKGPSQDSFANKLLTDVAAIPGGFAAGGPACPPTGGGECVDLHLWYSPDGASWTPATHEAASGVEGSVLLTGLTAGGPGVVGVGSDVTDVSAGAKDAATLTSDDGTSWVVHRGDPIFSDASTNSVVAGGPGLVAVGDHDGGTFAAWGSPDGTTWTSAQPPDGVPTGEARDSSHKDR